MAMILNIKLYFAYFFLILGSYIFKVCFSILYIFNILLNTMVNVMRVLDKILFISFKWAVVYFSIYYRKSKVDIIYTRQ